MLATPTQTTEIAQLVGIFDTALKNAAASLELSKTETLGRVASDYFNAFENARNALANDGTLPIVPGNDPHNVSSEDNSPIRVALSGVYGFTMHSDYATKSPHTIATLNHLKPIANAIHMGGYSIFT